MTSLSIYHEKNLVTPMVCIDKPMFIWTNLNDIGVTFLQVGLPPSGYDETGLVDIYKQFITDLLGEGRSYTTDVISVHGSSDEYEENRQKFLAEHIHDDEELRIFVHGSGNFLLHVDELVYAITCIAGDVIGVPSGMKHWFDAGENPSFTVLRVFTKEDGWLPHYTGWEK